MMDDATVGRLVVDDVSPAVSSGARPAKAVVGEHVPVRAAVWREGHDAVAATVVWRGPDGAWQTRPGCGRTDAGRGPLGAR